MPRSSMLAQGQVVASGLYFPEGLRWREDALWFSDVFGRRICRLAGTNLETIAVTAGMPSGLGWTPDGDLLFVSMAEREVQRLDQDGQVSVFADLTHLIDDFANDMVVDSKGMAYVGNYGFDIDHGAKQRTTQLVRIDPRGTTTREQPELLFPNGMVVIDGGRGLVVAETFADRLTRMDVSPEGTLSNPRVFVELPSGSGPDGIAVDPQGRIWVALAFGSRVLAYWPSGELAVEIIGDGRGLNCCEVSGDGHSLFVAVAPMDEGLAAASAQAEIIRCSI